MYKITDTEIKILNIIFEKPLTMKEITLEIGKNMSTVKTLVYRLIKKGIQNIAQNQSNTTNLEHWKMQKFKIYLV